MRRDHVELGRCKTALHLHDDGYRPLARVESGDVVSNGLCRGKFSLGRPFCSEQDCGLVGPLRGGGMDHAHWETAVNPPGVPLGRGEVLQLRCRNRPGQHPQSHSPRRDKRD